MDIRLQYYGHSRPASRCGTLGGRDVFLLDVDGRRQAIVRRSAGTSEQATPIFIEPDSDFTKVGLIEWSDSEAATKAKAWIHDLCTAQAAKLLTLANSLSGDKEPSR